MQRLKREVASLPRHRLATILCRRVIHAHNGVSSRSDTSRHAPRPHTFPNSAISTYLRNDHAWPLSITTTRQTPSVTSYAGPRRTKPSPRSTRRQNKRAECSKWYIYQSNRQSRENAPRRGPDKIQEERERLCPNNIKVDLAARQWFGRPPSNHSVRLNRQRSSLHMHRKLDRWQRKRLHDETTPSSAEFSPDERVEAMSRLGANGQRVTSTAAK